MLNRWWSMKTGDGGKPKERRRPYLASNCHNVVACERWRMQILREVGKKVTEIQNASLGEGKLRELNDEINKLVREKGHWERRILELGGPNYLHSTPDVIKDAGKEAEVGSGGYKYFGAARELPGVKELFAQPVEQKGPPTRGELNKGVDAEYFGFRDDEDGVLEAVENEAEEQARAKAIMAWKENNKGDTDMEDSEDYELTPLNVFVVPSKQDIERALVERHKAELMNKYAQEQA